MSTAERQRRYWQRVLLQGNAAPAAAALEKAKRRIAALEEELARAKRRSAELPRTETEDIDALRRQLKAAQTRIRNLKIDVRVLMDARRGHKADPLDILGLPDNATAEQIKARHRALVRRLHPDANRGDQATSGLLRQVNAAIEALRRARRVR